MNIPKYPVGIRSRVEKVKSLLKVESGGVHSIGIWGMAGVGKTTVARALFNEISCQFEESCFLPNVRRVLEKHGPGGLHHLQQKLLSQILKKHSVSLANFARGGELINQMLRCKKVLIVLDDMDDSHLLEHLAGKRDSFGDGSRVITTTRSFDLLGKHDVFYCVPELTNNEALELFSWHAFQQGSPVKDFEELSCCVVDYAKGLPLALEVSGSFIYKQSMIQGLYRLQYFRDGKIVRLLIIILDALGAEYKNIFLHIACFFRGKKKKDVITVLNRLGIFGKLGLDFEINVLKRSFFYISEGMIEMHDSIAQMSQQVARDAEQRKPWNCSRLWHGKDTNIVFSANQITRTPTFSVAPKNEANQKWKYDTFLSFRGDDTRNNFVAHLYKRLQDIGINVFKDDVKLERGKFISTELLKAIEESRTAIIIFSEDYASTTWCLEELTMIMKCLRAAALLKRWKNTGKISRLILRSLQPNMRQILLSGKKDETNHKDNLEKVQRWKDALHRAAGIAGLDVRKAANGNEAESIEKIINDNFRNMHHTVSATEKYLVGIESCMGEIESLLKFRSGDVCFIGIWGIGGVGKTTVARKYFDKISHQFQGSCFLVNVREECKKHGMMHLQKTLLSKLLKEKSMNITSFYEGADMIKRRLCHWKVLIVFDDVDDEDQLEYLVGNHDWFGGGSIIITTSRNQDLLHSHDHWHAFPKPAPDKEFLKLSKSVADYAKGLPLALKVLGSFLYKRGITEWRSALDRLIETGYEKIVKQLNIACFFRGRKRDDVITILNSFGFRSEIGTDILIKKSLFYVSEGIIEMHDLIKQMGQQVAHNVDQDKPWNHSRLWHEQDIKTVFSANQRAESIKGIMVPIGSDRHICKWSKAFRNMPCLRLLIVKGEEARHHDPIEYLLSNLKWLDWSYYSFVSLPADFEPGNLVGLNMTFSSLVEIFKEPKAFDKLTILNLSFSGRLLRTPNFCESPDLQKIILKSCESLIEIHPSIGNLKKLIFLNLENCKNLKSLPSSIQMESLESFNLSGCQKLGKFPEIRGNMESLSELLLARTAICELPSSIGQLSGISLLDLRSCENLVRLPASVCEMKKMKILILKGCSRLAIFPENLGDLNELEEIYADNTAIWQLPDSIGNLSKLKNLSLRKGWKVKHQSARSLLLPWMFHALRELKSLDLSGCNLCDKQAAALMNLASLLELNLSRNKFIYLPAIFRRLSHLRYLNIAHCQQRRIQDFEMMGALLQKAKESIANLQMYPRLKLVSFTNYSFDQQSFTMESNGRSISDEILSAIPWWFKYQSVGEKISFQLPINWYNDKFKGFAICCVALMGEGVCSPDSRLSGKYDYAFINAKLTCNHLKDLKVIQKECKVGTASRRHGQCVCFAYLPLYSSLQVGDINRYSLFEASMHGCIARQWGVHMIYEDERTFFSKIYEIVGFTRLKQKRG
ncbi:hypothetical protein H5410_033076 [Solanum commersonii]|uniref:ADP-ribosyl cyclase/cyclic ADP-ribose hydrolase n=1 Tax=Solanum commersonii TaxID=4109 RepID=A0A9J5YMM7_SOLCO|nr:hypothetical protein H5410_033076 [Solanum commersonii]